MSQLILYGPPSEVVVNATQSQTITTTQTTITVAAEMWFRRESLHGFESTATCVALDQSRASHHMIVN